MAEDIEQNNDLNLDDFNFDDLLAEEGKTDAEAGVSEDDVKFDFGDLTDTDFNFDGALSENASDETPDFLDNSGSQEVSESEDGVSDMESEGGDVQPDIGLEAGGEAADSGEPFSEKPDEENFSAGFDTGDDILAQENIEGEILPEGLSDADNKKTALEQVDGEAEATEEDAAVLNTEEISDETAFEAEKQNLEQEVFDASERDPDENILEPVQEETVSEETVVDAVLPPEQSDGGDDENSAEREEYFPDSVAVDEDGIVNDYAYGYDYPAVSGIEEPKNAGFLKWYSGSSSEKMVEISKGFESGSFDADEERKTIHVNVGYDTYGWEVQFSDGTVMNLRDVREYQLRNGRLPNSDGKLVYGQSALLFSGVERIVVYEGVRYFSYGI